MRILLRSRWVPYSKEHKKSRGLRIQNLHILWKFATQGQFSPAKITGMQSSRANYQPMHGTHCHILHELFNPLCSAVIFFLSPRENWPLFVWLHSSYFKNISRKGSRNVSRIMLMLRFPLISAKAVSKGICSFMAAGFWDSGLTPQGSLYLPTLTLYLCGESWLFEGHLPCFEGHLCWRPWGFWLDSYPNLSKHTFVNYRIILVWKRFPLHPESQLSTLSGESLLTSLPWVSTVCDP